MPPGRRGQYGGNVWWIDQPTVYPRLNPTPVRTPTIERVNNYDNYNTRLPASIIRPLNPPALGTTSRAYANARGSQAGLNIPGSTRATQGQGVYPVPQGNPSGNSGGGSNGGGGGGGIASSVGPATPTMTTADLSKNPYPGYYDKLLEYIAADAEKRPLAYDEAAARFKANQAESDKGIYTSYMDSRAVDDESSRALGVDPAIVSQARDLAMRKSKENSDQALADNLAWLQKAGILSKDQAKASYLQYAAEKAQKSAGWEAAEQGRVSDWNLALLQQALDEKVAAAKGGGGGGGGGRGGGSGGSSPYTDSASEEGTMYSGGLDWELYQELANPKSPNYDPAAAAEFMNMRNLNSGDKALSASQARVNDLTSKSQYRGTLVKPKVSNTFSSLLDKAMNQNRAILAASRNVPTIVKTGQANYAKKQLPAAKKSLNASQSISGDWGTTKWVKKVGSKSSQKY